MRKLPRSSRRIVIDRLTIDRIMGVYPEERVRMQPVRCRMELWLTPWAKESPGKRPVDYARLAESVRFILEQGQFCWLETAAEALAAAMLVPELDGSAPVEAIRVSLSKPEAFGGRGEPTVELTRHSADIACREVEAPHGTVRVVHQGPDATVFRLVVAGETPIFTSTSSEVAELAMESGLYLEGVAIAPFTGKLWPVGAPRQYQNLTAEPVEILAIARPWLVDGASGWLVWHDTPPPSPKLGPERELRYRLGRSEQSPS